MAALDRAIQLDTSADGRVRRPAYTQRGLLWRRAGDDARARADLAEAARLGSQFARSQLRLLNPYAAMCNQMLAEVMGALRRPGPSA